MKILTLNTGLSPWGKKKQLRLTLLVKELERIQPDIILLQELYFKSQANFIITKLKNHNYHSYYTGTLLTLTKFPILSKEYFPFRLTNRFSLTSFLVKLANWIYGKGYQMIIIKTLTERFLVINTHLLSFYGIDKGIIEISRRDEIEQVMNHLSKSGQKIIIGGDLNFNDKSNTYKYLIAKYDLVDPFATSNIKTITTDNLNRQGLLMIKMDEKIDHIFTNGFNISDFNGYAIMDRPIKTERGNLHISDHYGLLLEFNLNKQ